MERPDDLTARARIRDAALEHFAEHGYERTTIRDIARAAGVSPGLLRHHFGSKEDLRDACDEHVASALREINAHVLSASMNHDLRTAAAERSQILPYRRYLARMLVEGSKTASLFFDEMVTASQQWMTYLDQMRDDPPVTDLRLRAALFSAMAMGIAVLHGHITRTTGVDVFSDEGDAALANALLDIYSHPLMTPEQAAAARSEFTTTSAKEKK
jgi:AcrR family transcriptional regulator